MHICARVTNGVGGDGGCHGRRHGTAQKGVEVMEGHGKSWEVMEGHGRSWKVLMDGVMEGRGRQPGGARLHERL